MATQPAFVSLPAEPAFKSTTCSRAPTLASCRTPLTAQLDMFHEEDFTAWQRLMVGTVLVGVGARAANMRHGAQGVTRWRHHWRTRRQRAAVTVVSAGPSTIDLDVEADMNAPVGYDSDAEADFEDETARATAADLKTAAAFGDAELAEEKQREKKETYAYLRNEVGLSARQLGKVQRFWSASGGFPPSVERCSAVVSYLMSVDVGLTREQTAAVVADAAEILGVYSTETLREKMRFLMQEAGLEGDALVETIAGFPQILSRSITETLRPALEFWIGVAGVPREQLGDLFRRAKAQVWCKPETLQPKWRFAKDVMGLSLEQMLNVDKPFFRLSLQKTVAPRHFFLLKRAPTGRRVKLNQILGYSDKKFCQEVADCSLEEYERWQQADWIESEEYRTLAWIHPKRPGGNRRERSRSGRQRGGRHRRGRSSSSQSRERVDPGEDDYDEPSQRTVDRRFQPSGAANGDGWYGGGRGRGDGEDGEFM